MAVRFGSRALGAAASITLALALLGVAPHTQASDAPQASIAGYLAAGDALLAQMGDTKMKTALPRQGAPALKAFQEQEMGLLPILGTPKAPVGDLGAALDICDKSAKVLAGYALLGLANSINKDMPPQEIAQAAAKVQIKNISEYFDEMYPEFIFSYHCQATEVPLIDKFISSLPASEMNPSRLQGLTQIRNGGLHEQQGVMMIVSDHGLSEPRRNEILRLMSEDGRRYAAVLKKVQRDEVVKQAIQLMPTLTTEPQRRWLQDFIAAMSSTECSKLCSL